MDQSPGLEGVNSGNRTYRGGSAIVTIACMNVSQPVKHGGFPAARMAEQANPIMSWMAVAAATGEFAR